MPEGKMRLRDIASEITSYLRQFEADSENNSYRTPYYKAGACQSGRYVCVWYVSFQLTTHLTRAEAERYLAFLRGGGIGKHYLCEGGDMPEEKVSACVHKVNPETDRCVLCGKNRWNRCPTCYDVAAVRGENQSNCPDVWHNAPAADAGPRQQKWFDVCANCGDARGHHFGGNCPSPKGTKWKAAAPPVPQEAAPPQMECPDCGEAHTPGNTCRTATAPDEAMRVALKILQDHTTEEEEGEIYEAAALIRQAGSHERKHPPSNALLWKITRELPEQLQPMYCSMTPVPLEEIRSLISSALQDVANDEYAQAYEFFSRAGEAGSERERELETALRNLRDRLQIIMAWPDEHWSKHLPIEIESELAEASRLLGGESHDKTGR